MSRIIHQKKAIVTYRPDDGEPMHFEAENAKYRHITPIETRKIIIEIRFESIESLHNSEDQLIGKIESFLEACKGLNGYQDFMAEIGSTEKISLETLIDQGTKKAEGQKKGGERTKDLFKPDKDKARILWDSWPDKETHGRREAFINEACTQFKRGRSTINNWLKDWKDGK